MRRVAQVAVVVYCWAFAAAVVVQAYLAGMMVFDSLAWRAPHEGLGWGLASVSLLLPALAALARLPRRVVVQGLGLVGLAVLQVGLVSWLRPLGVPALTAVHPANAMLMLLLVTAAAREAQRRRPGGLEPASAARR